MNESAITQQNTNGMDWSVIEKVVLEGDLSKLSKQDRVNYYRMYCESLGLNPATRPFQYLKLNGKDVLYATKDATEQLRKLHNVSLEITSRERMDDLYVVTALARLPNGRTDSEIGAVSVTNLKGDALANAMMKATTKAKRRATLSICGLGVLDESEIHSIPNAQFVAHEQVDQDTGEIREVAPEASTPRNMPQPDTLPDKFIIRLEQLATQADVSFDQMDEDVLERYSKPGYIYLTTDEATDYAAWLKALTEEQSASAEQGELIEA